MFLSACASFSISFFSSKTMPMSKYSQNSLRLSYWREFHLCICSKNYFRIACCQRSKTITIKCALPNDVHLCAKFGTFKSTNFTIKLNFLFGLSKHSTLHISEKQPIHKIIIFTKKQKSMPSWVQLEFIQQQKKNYTIIYAVEKGCLKEQKSNMLSMCIEPSAKQ